MKYETITVKMIGSWHHGVVLNKGDITEVSKAIGEYMISIGIAEKK